MTLFKRGSKWWFHFWIDGQHVQRSTRQSNRKAAANQEAAMRTKIANGLGGVRKREPIPTFAEAMREFLEWSKNKHATHPATYQRYLTSSKALMRYFKNKRLDLIEARDVEQFKSLRASMKSPRTGRSLAPASINRELSAAKAVFNYAIKTHRLLLEDGNPFRSGKKDGVCDFFEEPGYNGRVISYAEQAKYLAEASQPLRDVATILVNTGMRPDECYRIEKSWVHIEHGYLRIPIGKTRAAKRRINLNATAAAIIRHRLETAVGKNLFPHANDANKPMLKVNAAHNGAVRRAGLPFFRLYDLRHSWATRAAQSGIDLVTLKDMLGHAHLSMLTRYAHPSERHQIEAAAKLEAYTTSETIAEFERLQAKSSGKAGLTQ